MIIDKAFCSDPRGYRWQFFPREGLDYFPIGEPLADIFQFEREDASVRLACPCGEYLSFDGDEWLGDVNALVRRHVEDKHPEKVTW